MAARQFGLLLLALATIIVAPSAFAQQVEVVMTVVFVKGQEPGADGGNLKYQKAQFAGAFKVGFAEAVARAGCLTKAPYVHQLITYTPNQPVPDTASIAFTYPYDPLLSPDLANGVAHVVANPVKWFASSDVTQNYGKVRTHALMYTEKTSL